MSDAPRHSGDSGHDGAPELAAGTRLGPYEIANLLGAGGMGVVYRARDTRLDRSVAIKVLLASTDSSPEQRARFEREAKAIAQLQHPGICTLHDVGTEQGREFLVMELLTGETLAARLERGPLPMAEVLTLGVGIATALAAAHVRDILHRDLKPANVMLTKAGPKLLDFGLAKLSAAGVFEGQGFTAARTVTGEGTIVGTIGYMAPEQLRGEKLDARADLWALGCVLYEMATGKSPFRAASTASTIAAILEHEPKPLLELLPLAPVGFDRLVHACLMKDPEGRWQSAADLACELAWLKSSASNTGGAMALVRAPASRLRRLAPWVAAGLAAAVAFILAPGRLHPVPGAAPGAIRAVLPLSNLGFDPFMVLASLSPDGKQVAIAPLYSMPTVGVRLLTLAGGTLRTLPDTEGGAQPFWSPDGSEVGFFERRRMRRIKISTGESTTICELTDDPRGAAWGSQGVIVFSGGRSGGLFRVADTGGVAQSVTQVDKLRSEATHRWPVFLPDGQRFLYYASDNISDEHEAVLLGSLDGSPPAVLLTGVTNAVVAAGHLLYIRLRDNTLVAQSFDAARGAIEGDAVPLATEPFYGMGANLAPISASDAGDLLYLSAPSTWDTELGWFDRAGRRQGTLAEPAPWLPGRISPDRRWVVAARTDIAVHPARTDLWLFDLASGRRTRLTFGPGDSSSPAWSGDSRRIVYGHYAKGEATIHLLTLPEGRDQMVGSEPRLAEPSFDWSSDGRTIAYTIFNSESGSYDLQELDVATGVAQPLLASKADERYPRYSPDGLLVAYSSNESGRHEIYVRRRHGEEKWQASVDGGRMPHWARMGGELTWLAPDDHLVTAAVEPGQAVRFGVPARDPESRPFTATQWFDYDLTSDGRRVLADAPLPSALDPKVRIIVNWPTLMPR